MLPGLRKTVLYAVDAYRYALSPFLPGSCRFTPSCSAYSKEAIEKYGVPKGFYLSFRRLMRCHPFNSGGHDPVK